MADMAHEHGSLAGVELWHGGCVAGNLETRIAARAASAQMAERAVLDALLRARPRPTSASIQGYYVEAAKRARDVGFDIVNVHGAEGGAITAHFLMAKSNNSAPTSTAARWRTARASGLETLEQVREAVGDDCAITARLCIDTLNDSPLGIRAAEEAYGFIALADHLVDFWDLQAGGWSAAEWHGDDASASRFVGEFIRSPLPRGGAQRHARSRSPRSAASPTPTRWPRRSARARSTSSPPPVPRSPTRSCRRRSKKGATRTSASASAATSAPRASRSRRRSSAPRTPPLGEEFRRGWHPERFATAANADKTVLVVGAGPAGMECAMVLGERGMSAVHLVDEQEAIGGSLRRVSAYPNLGEWARVINYRQIQLDKLANVEVIPKTRLDAEGVLNYGAEIVVVATGARWRADGMNGPTQRRSRAPSSTSSTRPSRSATPRARSRATTCSSTTPTATSPAVGDGRDAARGRQARDRASTPLANFAPFMFFTGEAFRVNREIRERGA